MRTKTSDPAIRLAQEIIQFAKANNMKVRKKRRPATATSKNEINK